jgi:DNA-binding NarL/FixJ family response regulator
MPFSVLVVDDAASVVEILAVLIDGEADLSVAGRARDGLAAVHRAVRSCPDAIICDQRMPRLQGLEALPLLRRACPDTVIVMYTSNPDDIAAEAYRLGADAVLDKLVPPSEAIDLVVTLCHQRELG